MISSVSVILSSVDVIRRNRKVGFILIIIYIGRVDI